MIRIYFRSLTDNSVQFSLEIVRKDIENTPMLGNPHLNRLASWSQATFAWPEEKCSKMV